MVDKKIWFSSGAHPGMPLDVAEDEPSHIHVPRPSRVGRPEVAEGSSATSLALGDVPPAGTRR